MAQKEKTIKWAVFLFVLIALAATAYANGSLQPGSADDPIVTKSYVDEQIQLLKQQLGGQPAGSGSNGGGGSGALPALKVEKLRPGQKVIGAEGTEFIVRSGKVRVIASVNGGIPDLTEGVDLADGDLVPLDHLLLIPRSDNRGIEIVQGGGDGYSYVVIRGKYTIQ